MILHPWSNPCMSSYLSIYLWALSFWLQSDLPSFFCFSLMESAVSCISPSMAFFLWLGDWHLSLVALPSPIQDEFLSYRSGFFNGLMSGGVNCSDLEVARGWCFRPWNPRWKLWSIIPLSAQSLWLWGQFPIPTAQSHWNVFYFMWIAMPPPFCCPFWRNHHTKFVLQGWWFGPPLLPVRQWKSFCILSYGIKSKKTVFGLCTVWWNTGLEGLKSRTVYRFFVYSVF